MAMTKFSMNNLRLALKTLINLWVPVVVLTGLVSWSPETVAVVAAASVGTIDALFRVISVGDDTPAT